VSLKTTGIALGACVCFFVGCTADEKAHVHASGGALNGPEGIAVGCQPGVLQSLDRLPILGAESVSHCTRRVLPGEVWELRYPRYNAVVTFTFSQDYIGTGTQQRPALKSIAEYGFGSEVREDKLAKQAKGLLSPLNATQVLVPLQRDLPAEFKAGSNTISVEYFTEQGHAEGSKTIAYAVGMKFGLSTEWCTELSTFQTNHTNYLLPSGCAQSATPSWVPLPLGLLERRDGIYAPEVVALPNTWSVRGHTWPPASSLFFLDTRTRTRAAFQTIVSELAGGHPIEGTPIKTGQTTVFQLHSQSGTAIFKEGTGNDILVEDDIYQFVERSLEFRRLVPATQLAGGGILIEYIPGFSSFSSLYEDAVRSSFPAPKTLALTDWNALNQAPLRSERGMQIGIVDYLIGNNDRVIPETDPQFRGMIKNVIIDVDGQPFAIDHGASDPVLVEPGLSFKLRLKTPWGQTQEVRESKGSPFFSINRAERAQLSSDMQTRLRALQVKLKELGRTRDILRSWAQHRNVQVDTLTCLLRERVSALLTANGFPSTDVNRQVLTTCGVDVDAWYTRQAARLGVPRASITPTSTPKCK